MTFKEYKSGTALPGGASGVRSTFPQTHRAKEGAPNVLFIVQAANIDNLAKNGLLFNNTKGEKAQ